MNPILEQLPSLSKGETSDGWVPRIAAQVDKLREIISGLDVGVGLSLSVDGNGNMRIDIDGLEGAAAIENYGFRVWVDESNKVHYATGTAQVWGGTVKTYEAANRNNATDGYYVYAVCDLTATPPAWDNTLAYGPMTGQTAGEEIWVPIARTDGNASDGWTVTQLHWGNIVIPAIANVVDVQQASAPSS